MEFGPKGSKQIQFVKLQGPQIHKTLARTSKPHFLFLVSLPCRCEIQHISDGSTWLLPSTVRQCCRTMVGMANKRNLSPSFAIRFISSFSRRQMREACQWMGCFPMDHPAIPVRGSHCTAPLARFSAIHSRTFRPRMPFLAHSRNCLPPAGHRPTPFSTLVIQRPHKC